MAKSASQLRAEERRRELEQQGIFQSVKTESGGFTTVDKRPKTLNVGGQSFQQREFETEKDFRQRALGTGPQQAIQQTPGFTSAGVKIQGSGRNRGLERFRAGQLPGSPQDIRTEQERAQQQGRVVSDVTPDTVADVATPVDRIEERIEEPERVTSETLTAAGEQFSGAKGGVPFGSIVSVDRKSRKPDSLNPSDTIFVATLANGERAIITEDDFNKFQGFDSVRSEEDRVSQEQAAQEAAAEQASEERKRDLQAELAVEPEVAAGLPELPIQEQVFEPIQSASSFSITPGFGVSNAEAFDILSNPDSTPYDLFMANGALLQQQLQAQGLDDQIIANEIATAEARKRRVADQTSAFLGMIKQNAENSKMRLEDQRDFLITKLERQEERLLGKQSDSVSDLNDKRDAALATMKARMSLMGVSLDSSFGLNTVASQTIQWDKHIQDVESSYDDRMIDIFDKQQEVMFSYTDSVERIDANLQADSFEAVQNYSAALDSIDDNTNLLIREKAEKRQEALIKFQENMVNLAGQAREAEMEARKEAREVNNDLAKQLSEHTGIVYTTDKEGEITALIDPQTGNPVQNVSKATEFINDLFQDLPTKEDELNTYFIGAKAAVRMNNSLTDAQKTNALNELDVAQQEIQSEIEKGRSGGFTSFDVSGIENFNDGSQFTPSEAWNIASNATDQSRSESDVLPGVLTGVENGSSAWAAGLDVALDGGKNANVRSPFNGTLLAFDSEIDPDGFGNRAIIQRDNGNIVWINHLDSFNGVLSVGDRISKGTVLGKQGNSGTTIFKDKNGNLVTQVNGSVNPNRGMHVDITEYKNDVDLSGKSAREVVDHISRNGLQTLTSREVYAGVLAEGAPPSRSTIADEFAQAFADGTFTRSDLQAFGLNEDQLREVALKSRRLQREGVEDPEAVRIAEDIFSGASDLTLQGVPQKQRASVARELNKLKELALKTGDTVGIMRASAGGKSPSDSFINSFEKAATVINQLSTLNDLINKNKFTVGGEEFQGGGPLIGRLEKLNPFDTEAQAIQAQLVGITPNLARGIFGEVGVLTDRDIALYQSTLPNLTQTKDVQKAVTALTLRTVANALKNKVEIAAGAGRDVSGNIRTFEILDEKVKELESELGIERDTIPEQEEDSGFSSNFTDLIVQEALKREIEAIDQQLLQTQ